MARLLIFFFRNDTVDARAPAQEGVEVVRSVGDNALGNGATRKRLLMATTRDGEDAPLLHDKPPSALNRAFTYVVNQGPMIILLLVVIGLGSANRVMYKIQLTPMGNYPLFISWIITSTVHYAYALD